MAKPDRWRCTGAGTLLAAAVLTLAACGADTTTADTTPAADSAEDGASGSDSAEDGGSDDSTEDNASGSDSDDGGGSDDSTDDNASGSDDSTADNAGGSEENAGEGAGGELFPDVVAASARLDGDGSWTFDATLSSPYDSPERYADAWRVVGPDGTVYGIRELAHDHAAEQPFTRSQSGIEIPDDVMTVTVEGRDQVSGWGGATVDVDLAR